MAVLMPALRKAKEQGQSSVCKGNLKGFSLAVAMYAQDNDDQFPDSDVCYFYGAQRYPTLRYLRFGHHDRRDETLPGQTEHHHRS